MALYNPPLRLFRKEDWNSTQGINNALERFKIDYFYTGKRISNQLIELKVCTIIEDAQDNIFIRYCQYSGNKDKWKEVILDQLKNELRDLGVEEGFVKAETRWIIVSKENHLSLENFEIRKRDFVQKVTAKKGD